MTPKVVMEAVSRYTGTPLEDLLGLSHEHHLMRPRRLLYACLREIDLSYPVIGRLVNRHHSTVMKDLQREQASPYDVQRVMETL